MIAQEKNKTPVNLAPFDQLPAFAIIIRAMHTRGEDQQAAFAALERRRLWLSPEQRLTAGLES